MAFATSDDVATRLERPLSDEEAANVDLLLDFASTLVADAAGKGDDWTPDPVPNVVRLVTVEAVYRVMVNPSGSTFTMEQLGSYQFSERFDAAGLALTERERRSVRRAVNGALTSVTLESPYAGETTGDLDLLLP